MQEVHRRLHGAICAERHETRTGNTRRVRFSRVNVVYDEEGYDYPIDDEGRLSVPLD